MSEEAHNVICPKCGHVYTGYKNYYGKVCYRCHTVIEPEEEPIIIQKINKLKQSYHDQIREYFRRTK